MPLEDGSHHHMPIHSSRPIILNQQCCSLYYQFIIFITSNIIQNINTSNISIKFHFMRRQRVIIDVDQSDNDLDEVLIIGETPPPRQHHPNNAIPHHRQAEEHTFRHLQLRLTVPAVPPAALVPVTLSFNISGAGTISHRNLFRQYAGRYDATARHWEFNNAPQQSYNALLQQLRLLETQIENEHNRLRRVVVDQLFHHLHLELERVTRAEFIIKGYAGHPEATTRFSHVFRSAGGIFQSTPDPNRRGYTIGHWRFPLMSYPRIVNVLQPAEADAASIQNAVVGGELYRYAGLMLVPIAGNERKGYDMVLLPTRAANNTRTIQLAEELSIHGGCYCRLTDQHALPIVRRFLANQNVGHDVQLGGRDDKYWQFLRVHVPLVCRMLRRVDREMSEGQRIPVEIPMKFMDANIYLYPHIDYEKRGDYFVVKTTSAEYRDMMRGLCEQGSEEHFEPRVGWVFLRRRRVFIVVELTRMLRVPPQVIPDNTEHYRPEMNRIKEGRVQGRA